MSPAAPSDPLVEALLDPGRYPHEAHDLALAETHISWVLLAGPYAYKIKKPLELPFLDFSTLERRRHFCEEELRLNRRLAPELYLEVLPIGGSREDPRLGATPAVEYAVRMKRFPADAALDRRLARDRVSSEAIAALAELLARFHAALPAERGKPAAEAARVFAAAMDNFEPLEAALRDADQQRLLGDVHAWIERQGRALADTFGRRIAAGFVKEGHGDLHLENLVEIEGRILPFDALEFDRALRLSDVISEAAFLVMDLMAHRRTDLGFVFLNRYLENTGDYPGLGVLRFYLVHRALVRAKVRVIKASQETTLHTAEHGPRPYLRLAHALVAPPRPALVITHGLSGSGKTTITDRLLQHLPAIRVRSDLERKRLHGLEATARSGSAVGGGLYDGAATERTYAALAAHAAHAVSTGFHAIVDAAFLSRARREQFRALAEKTGARFRILDCQAADDSLRKRIRAREQHGHDASAAGEAVLAYQLQHREPLTPAEQRTAVIADTEHAIDFPTLAQHLLE
jgi:uncharacterized protein